MPLVVRGICRGTAHEGETSVRRDRARCFAPFCFITRRADDSRVSRDAQLILDCLVAACHLRVSRREKAAVIAGRSIGRRRDKAPDAFSMSREASPRNPPVTSPLLSPHAANFVPRAKIGRAHV